MLPILGLIILAPTLTGRRWRSLRCMEDALPDAVPGAKVTWDRDALQREADQVLANECDRYFELRIFGQNRQ
jgi:hypothetical protein